MKSLVIVGAGGFGRETLDVIAAINRDMPTWNVVGVLDDSPSASNLGRLGDREVKHIGGLVEVSNWDPIHFVLGVGSPPVRDRLASRLEGWGHRAATIVHPRAVVGSRSVVAEGTVVCSGAQISTNVSLGRHVHVNPNATVGHDAQVHDYVSINPGAVISGEVLIASHALVGAGAVILQGLRVGHGATVGAAACVTKDVRDRAVVAGVPARQQPC